MKQERQKLENERLQVKNAKILGAVDLDGLNGDQMRLLRPRALLLQYLDRLNTYEELNGGFGSEKARKNFNAQGPGFESRFLHSFFQL